MYKLKNVAYILIILVSIFMLDSLVCAYKSYSIGDTVKYNDIEFYVIKDSSSEEDSVTMLKAEPLTVEEVNLYGEVGTVNNHVNRYTRYYKGETHNTNGYGGMTFYSSELCGYKGKFYSSECKNNYELSDIKYVVDAWANEKINQNDILTDYTGYSVRLIADDDLLLLGYVKIEHNWGLGYYYSYSENVLNWVYNEDYQYWTMVLPTTIYTSRSVTSIYPSGELGLETHVYNYPELVVRPVVTFSKVALEDIEEKINDDNKSIVESNDNNKTNENIHGIKNNNNNNNNNTSIVSVPNTLQKISIISIMIGVILISVSIVIVVKNRK